MATATLSHVRLGDQGRPRIRKSNYKVVILLRMMLGEGGLCPEEMQENYPDLTLGEVHSMLAYYHDHRDEMEAEFARRDRVADEVRQQHLVQFSREELSRRSAAMRSELPTSEPD
jgi:uncharacterized protein (DUF433 family)